MVRVCVAFVFVGLMVASLSSCSQIQKPETKPFISVTEPPSRQEFRWTNGKMLRSFDPARAASAPETDVVRSLYEGLTELDPRSLDAIPGVAEKWSSSEDARVWTFYLRRNARWTNGRRVTARDFVSAWIRLYKKAENTPFRPLMENIVGFGPDSRKANVSPNAPDFQSEAEPVSDDSKNERPSVNYRKETAQANNGRTASAGSESDAQSKIGIAAIDDATLVVKLISPDKDFPRLTAAPAFRPVFGDGSEFDSTPLYKDAVTNGPFDIAEISSTELVVKRSETYWDRENVKLETIRFLASNNAEEALNAYLNGRVDVVTNANFTPAALKLMAPYDDFRQSTHSAINYFELNDRRPPLTDRRVREALAISLDREKLVDSELDGAVRPAFKFLPVGGAAERALHFDAARGRELLSKAGFPNGENFPELRLIVNRNETQQRIARTASRMWKQNLNIDVQVITKEPAEIEAAVASSDFDLIRRGVVLPTADEFVSLSLLFPRGGAEPITAASPQMAEPTPFAANAATDGQTRTEPDNEAKRENEIQTEDTRLFDLTAIPLYFPNSYSLVKPYVRNFDINPLEAPLISTINIDEGWRPADTKTK